MRMCATPRLDRSAAVPLSHPARTRTQPIRYTCWGALTHARRHTGSLDPSMCMRAFTKKEYIYANIAILEFLLWTCDRLSVQRGWLSRQVNVFDADGLGVRHLAPRLVRQARANGRPCVCLAQIRLPPHRSVAPWSATQTMHRERGGEAGAL